MSVAVVVLVVVITLAVVVAIAFYAIGREVARLERTVRPAVYEVEEAVHHIASALPEDVAGRLTHDDVRWILRVDAEELELATAEAVAAGDLDEVVDPDGAVGRVLARLEAERPDLSDVDVVAVLDARLDHLRLIGAVGDQADRLD